MKKLTKLYIMWANMKARCNDSNRPDYKYYGGKGITYAPEWEKFKPFESWAIINGYIDGLSIDRRDGNLGYNPDNCRFIPLPEQQRNKCNNIMLTYKGETKTLGEWANKIGIPWKTLKSRIELGFTIEQAIEKKKGALRTSRLYHVDGASYSLTQLAQKFGFTKHCLYGRLKKGMSAQDAISKPSISV